MKPSPHPPDSAQATHRRELGRLAVFVAGLGLLAASTYLIPDAEAVRPWLPGEDLPLVGLATRQASVQEDLRGDLSVRELPAAAVAQPVVTDVEGPTLPLRSPAIPTPIEGAPGALDDFFLALATAEAGYPGAVVRALHWGDSTIAGDGITSTVRDRLQARFGDAGPGFLAVAVDPRWSIRPGIARWTKGPWESLSITFGGAERAAYGLAGTLSVAPAGDEASATLGGRKRDDAEKNSDRQLIHRVDIYYARQPGGGGLYIKPKGAAGVGLSTDSGNDRSWDAFHMLTSPEGSPTVWLKADGSGPVNVYGVALETNGPGLTWETFGVAGSGQGSILKHQARGHIAAQVERRQPHLMILQTGGNELGYPSLKVREGSLYAETFVKTLHRLRGGAPDAACLVITPLDQATRDRGEVISKPMLTRMIALQRQAAFDAGCGFWDARAAMGGEGAFNRWLSHQPKLAWTDLMHLTDEGLELVGHSLADAVEFAFDEWKEAHPDLVPTPYVAAQPRAASQATPGALPASPQTPAPPAPSP